MPRINYEPHQDIAIGRIQHNINRVLDAIPQFQELSTTATGAGIRNKVLPHALNKPPRGAWLAYLRNKTAPNISPTLGAYLDWQPDSNGIRITNITGLDDSSVYEIRILIYA